MKSNPAKLILFLVITIFIFSCSKDGDNIKTVTISDEIPYNAIGSGKILFNRNNSFYLIKINEQNVSELQIDPVGDCAISPDGEVIAYASYMDILHLINIDGSVYAEQTYANQCFSTISWSMDSKRIIYFDPCYGDPANLYEMNVKEHCCTSKLIRTFSHSSIAHGILSPFSISVNNDMVFYASSDIEEFQFSGIYTMNKVGADLKCIYTDDSVGVYYQNPYSHKSYSNPTWSPTDEKIAFVSNKLGDYHNTSEIILIDRDGNNAETIVKFDNPSVSGECPIHISSICWSPDGTKIAFSKFEECQVSHIYMIELDSNEITQITFEEGVQDDGISWSK